MTHKNESYQAGVNKMTTVSWQNKTIMVNSSDKSGHSIACQYQNKFKN